MTQRRKRISIKANITLKPVEDSNRHQLVQLLEVLRLLPRKDGKHIYMRDLAPLEKACRGDHNLALALWETSDLAARELAVRIADPEQTDPDLLEKWVCGLDEWGLTDAFAGHLVKKTSFAVEKAKCWAQREQEFERRAGFATMAQMAWSKSNGIEDDVFISFMPYIEQASGDSRFYVKKAVNWALRDIAKRNAHLRGHVYELAERLIQGGDKTARWVAQHRAKEWKE